MLRDVTVEDAMREPRVRVPMLKVDVPEGRSGDWAVERFEVDEDGARRHNLQCDIRGQRFGYIAPGTYTRLMCGDDLIMSDTPSEMWDHLDFVHRATGSLLINGLGLGMVLKNVLAKPGVTDVVVVEKSPDVVALVAPTYASDPRVAVIVADAMEFQPPKGKVFDAVWHDIWPDICNENLPEMHRLHRRYGRRARWQGSWSRETIEAGRWR